MVDKYVNGGDR